MLCQNILYKQFLNAEAFLISMFIMAITGCSSSGNGTFNTEELVSSKQEKIYINTLNWCVTDNNQIFSVSSDRNKLLKKGDTLNAVKGLEPFIYTFKKDTLNLYFDGQVNYSITEKFKTFIALDKKEFAKDREKVYKNEDGYCTVPKSKKKDYPSDMPKPPSN